MKVEQAEERSWYAVSARSRQERAAADDLLERGFEVFLPTRVERRMWSDRIRRLEVALFPGYLFVHTQISAQRRVDLLKARGIFDLVGRLPGDARIARAIPEWQIMSLRALVEAERELDPTDALVKGTLVEVGAGPLRGARGVVEVAMDGKRRLVVQVDLLGRGVRCVLQADDVIVARPRQPESDAAPGSALRALG